MSRMDTGLEEDFSVEGQGVSGEQLLEPEDPTIQVLRFLSIFSFLHLFDTGKFS